MGGGGLGVALCLLAGCYSGVPEPGTPWAGDDDAADSGSDGGEAADDAANDSADAADDGANDSANDSVGETGVDDGSADAADVGTDDGAGTDGTGDASAGDASAGDAGTTDGGDSAGDGGANEVPDNDYCMEYADWDPQWSTLEQQILDIVNQHRAAGANCGSQGSFGSTGPLAMNPALRCAARKHSKQMVTEDFFDHTTPWGETPGDRIEGAGYSWSTWGENIAAGNSTAAATMQQWMDSDGHCANIMNPSFQEIGVGYYPGGGYGHYWTQAFGAP